MLKQTDTLASDLCDQIQKCTCIEEVEDLFDRIDDAASNRVISEDAFKWLSNECDDRISYLLEVFGV